MEPTPIEQPVEPLQVIEPGKCDHVFVPDPTDESEHFIAMICRFNCGMGYLARKVDAKK